MKTAILMSSAALVAGHFAISSAEARTVDLLAGQTINVGQVEVTEDGTDLMVTYTTVDPWWIKETHLFAHCDEVTPTTRSGNPKVGQFPFSGTPTGTPPQEVEITIPLVDIGCELAGDTVTIAAHAVVFDSESTVELDVVSDATERVTRFRAGDGPTPFEDQTTDEPAAPAWEHPAWSTISNPAAPNAGADWIWAASGDVDTDGEHFVTFPEVGAALRFEKTFDIPGPPVSGDLFINCDNGFEAFVNDVFVEDGDVSGDWRNSDLGFLTVISSNWATTRTEDVSLNLVEGENLLVVDAANAAVSGATKTSNPGGCIFLLAAEYSDTVETAWGDGDRITTRGNWTTEFEFPYPEAE